MNQLHIASSLRDNDSNRKSDAQPRGSTLKFASPVKAHMIENYGESYVRSVGCAMGLGLANVVFGAVVMAMFIYSAKCGDGHEVLFTLAYHFFVAEAILALSYINGWYTPMRWKHRKYTHMILQVCGIICSVTGTIYINGDKIARTLHGISGLITLVLTVLALICGPLVLRGVEKANLYHMTFGIPCFFMSTVCVMSGLLHPHFKQWAGDVVNGVLMSFILFYTTFILVTTYMKCVKKI